MSYEGRVTDRFFAYEFDPRYRFLWGLMGAKPDRDGITLTDDGRFVATYGRFRLETPLTNVAGAHVTGPYQWWKAVGARLSLADDGLTLGTSTGPGVCVHFEDRVHRVFGFRDHSAVTATVADPDGLVAELGEAEPR